MQHVIPCSTYGGYTLPMGDPEVGLISEPGRAVTSIETVNRIPVKVLKTGVKAHLVEEKVTMVSVDNVDVLQPC